MNTSEISRLIANLIKKGEVVEVDSQQALVRVRCGELVTDWLPYLVSAAGGVSVHRPPSVGEIALLVAPSGETADAMVICGWSGKKYKNPAVSADVTVVRFPDGGQCEYNHQNGSMNISGIKNATVTAADKVTFDTPSVICTGRLTVQGLLTYESGLNGNGGGAGTTVSGPISHQGVLTNRGAVVSNNINLSSHTHGGVQAGGDQTDKPK